MGALPTTFPTFKNVSSALRSLLQILRLSDVYFVFNLDQVS